MTIVDIAPVHGDAPHTAGDIGVLFRRLLVNEVSHHRDADGRPLGEQRVPELYAATETQLRTCPYPGSRHLHERPMNVSALRQITGVWRPVVRSLATLTKEYLRRERLERLDYFHFWRLTYVGLSLPSFLAYRAVDPVADGALAPTVAAIYKVLLGVAGVAGEQAILAAVCQRRPPARVLLRGARCIFDPTAMATHVERHGQLIGKAEVCAGPANLISEALRAAMLGEADGAPDPGALQGAIGDLDAFFAFGLAAADLALAFLTFILWTRRFDLRCRVPRLGLGLTPTGDWLRAALASGLANVRARQTGPIPGVSAPLDSAPGWMVTALFEDFQERLPQLAGCLHPVQQPDDTRMVAELAARLEADTTTWAPLPVTVRDWAFRARPTASNLLARTRISELRAESAFLHVFSEQSRVAARALGLTPNATPVTAGDLVAAAGATHADLWACVFTDSQCARAQR